MVLSPSAIAGRPASLALAILFVAGCASSAPTTSVGSPAAVTTPPASSAPGATQPTAGPTANASGGLPIPGFNADPALEAQLPSDVRGRSLAKISVRGADLPSFGGGQADAFREMFSRLGTSPQNMTVAMALDMTGSLGAQAIAFRLVGTDATRLIGEFTNAAKSGNSNAVIGQVTLGGKNVTTITVPGSAEGILYAYPKGDTVFMVQAKDQGVAEEILRQMP
jgi:hypothetical protein